MRLKRKEVRRGEKETEEGEGGESIQGKKKEGEEGAEGGLGGAEEMAPGVRQPGVGRDRELWLGTSPRPPRSQLVGLAAGKSGGRRGFQWLRL